MIFKCKICGGELNVDKGQSTVECEYCGVKQTLPKFFDESTKLMYDRANNYLIHQEFDKAENIFRQILHSDNADSEAYWGLVLCKYGILYVKDPKTKKYIPTCNRTYYSSIFDDENYKNAVKFADEEKAQLYKTNAKTIDDIQRRIISVSKHEKPFDIFISYKETAANGGRTKDSAAAQDLYEKLTLEGYKVFFSRITLEDKIGTEYEPYIYAALASSKVMITVCSSKENIESVWVKNEWSRFLGFAQRDNSKTILPLYFDMDKSELPDEFANLAAYDMQEDGFEQDLIRGIKKLIPLPVMEKERRKKRKKIFARIGAGIAACVVAAAVYMIPWFMKLPEYNAAMQLYNDKNYPEATWAFDKMGGYRDSKEMKQKCELSWRKSLATVVTDDYYINENGYIESYGEQGLENDLNSGEHGRVISILPTYGCTLPSQNDDEESREYVGLYALYEDGTYKNSYNRNICTSFSGEGYIVIKSDHYINNSDKNDIIQMIPLCEDSTYCNGGTMLTLHSDGKVLYHKTREDSIVDSEIMKSVLLWENIVQVIVYVDEKDEKDLYIIAGITSDGRVNVVNNDVERVYKDDEYYCNTKISNEIELLSTLDGIKTIDFCIQKVRNKGVGTAYFDFMAINDSKIISYIGRKFVESEPKDITEVKLNETSSFFLTESVSCILYKNGDFLVNNELLLTDVRYINNGYAITNSGEVYKYDVYSDITIKPLNIKTCVYDEWKER